MSSPMLPPPVSWNMGTVRPRSSDQKHGQTVTTSQDVLPRALPRHEVAPGPQPEDVQHADVLTPVLGQVLRPVR